MNDRSLPDLDDNVLREMGVTREEFEKRRDNFLKRALDLDKRAPRVGKSAPDFEVERLSPTGSRTGEMFRLSSLRGAAVALVFGSYT
jgi:hypothetical protein